jgi:YHS domain-containing protein
METKNDTLLQRLEAEFEKSRDKLEELRRKKVDDYQGRRDRLTLFDKACESLRGVWVPRLETLKKAFGERVNVTPHAAGSRREATFSFTSSVARITMRFAATTDFDVRNLVLEYTLDIVPVLMTFPDQARLEQPFDKLDPDLIGKWIDDRIVDFVRTYLSLHENEYYLKAHMVEDPIAHVRFPKFAAATTLERGGQTYYFIANETRAEFEAKNTN